MLVLPIFGVRISSTFSVLRPFSYLRPFLYFHHFHIFDLFCTSTIFISSTFSVLRPPTLRRPKLYFDLNLTSTFLSQLYFDLFVTTLLGPFCHNFTSTFLSQRYFDQNCTSTCASRPIRNPDLINCQSKRVEVHEFK